MLKVAVIGLGDISPIHIEAIKNSPNAELVAVCDINGELKSTNENVNFYVDYTEMLQEESLDCVHVCLPHYLHYPVTKACVERGINVYLEKPLAKNAEEGMLLVKLAKKHPETKICVSLQNRLNDTFVEMKKIIDSGALGKVTGIKGLVTWYRPKSYYDVKPWRGIMKYSGGGVMINQSIHTLDQMQVIGGEIDSIRASIDQLIDYGYEVEDTAVANIKFKNGATGLFFATTTYSTNSSVELQVVLEKGKLTIKDFLLYRTNSEGVKEKIAEDQKLPGSKFYYGASHDALINRFYNAILENLDNYIHVEDAQASMDIIAAIRRSSELKIPVRMELFK